VQFYLGENANYQLFDTITGVRERGFEQIVAPRGLPADVLQNFASHPAFDDEDENEGYGITYEELCQENHTPSWLLRQELIDFPWQGKIRTTTGYVDPENYQLRKTAKASRYEKSPLKKKRIFLLNQLEERIRNSSD